MAGDRKLVSSRADRGHRALKASIVTVTHRSAGYVARYVDSFLAHHGREHCNNIEFVFVENSGDAAITDLLQPLRHAGYRVELLFMENRGFGAACNLGAKAATGQVLMFINPDVTCIGSFKSIESLEGNWGTGRQIDENGRIFSFDILPEHKSLFLELTRRHLRMTPPPPKWLDRLFPVGAFFCVDREHFANVGGFNERFFLYHEEAELARRLHRVAGPPSYVADLAVLHHQFGSETSRSLTSVHELDGLFSYATVVGSRSVLRKRLFLLLAMAPFRSDARSRLWQFAQKWRNW
jgi:GT2 family glycosyltransferase